MKKLLKITDGVIMMETLLSLPIYIVMLAGLFWLGESAMARVSLIDGERYILWTSGNRHNSNNNVIRHIFYFLDATGDITLRASIDNSNNFPNTSSAYNWGNITQGQLTGNTKRSQWSWGAAESIRSMHSELSLSETPGQNEEDLIAKGGNVMIFSRRAGNARRNGDTSYNSSVDYMTIAGSTWGTIIQPSVGGVSAISAYARNANFVNWSN